MGINQAIFTSAARGVGRSYGGLALYSYNPSISEEELAAFQESYASYSISDAAAEGLEIEKYPKRFLFGKTGEGRLGVTNIVYLGRDYNKEAGRMGNILSHMYSFEKGKLPCYPMELYGSSDFRTFMYDQEVDGSRDPEYLEEKSQVTPGNEYTIERIQDFLGEDRMEMFCHMLAAVFARDGVNKVIIYDTEENVRLWIAALEFALPRSSAAALSFSTYEAKPLYSSFDIRGAIDGFSEFPADWLLAPNQHYVFNGITGIYPKFDIGGDFFTYGIDLGMSFGYESLQQFHEFIEEYDYENADRDICDAYLLFQMVRNGMSALQNQDIEKALKFESRFGSQSTQERMLGELLENMQREQNPEKSTVLRVKELLLAYCKKGYGKVNEKETAKQLFHLMRLYADMAGCGDKETEQFFQEIIQAAQESGVRMGVCFADEEEMEDFRSRIGGIDSIRKYKACASWAGLYADTLGKPQGDVKVLDQMLYAFFTYMNKHQEQKEDCILYLAAAFAHTFDYEWYVCSRTDKFFAAPENVGILRKMWQKVISHVLREKTHATELLRLSAKEKIFCPCGYLCAYLIEKDSESDPEDMMLKMLTKYFQGMEENQYCYLDSIIGAVQKRLSENEKTRYRREMKLFLNIQETYKEFVYGPGMNALIESIEDQTPSCESRKMKKKSADLAEMQTKCALYVFNYIAKYKESVRDTNLRMLHLGRCLAKYFNSEESLEKQGALKIYAAYPVYLTSVEEKEFDSYLDWIFDEMEEKENEEKDYTYLLQCWVMSEDQKEEFLGRCLEQELAYVKSSGNPGPLAALVVSCCKAEEKTWKKILCKLLEETKESRKEKAEEAISKEFGSKSESLRYWRACCQESESGGQSGKKTSIFRRFRKD